MRKSEFINLLESNGFLQFDENMYSSTQCHGFDLLLLEDSFVFEYGVLLPPEAYYSYTIDNLKVLIEASQFKKKLTKKNQAARPQPVFITEGLNPNGDTAR